MEQTLEIIGTIVGLVYLWLEYRASIYLWIAGIIMPAIYIYYLPLGIIFAVTFVGIAWILIRFTNSNVPWLDSFTTALSIVGMWMLARKYVEQWWAWIVVDIVSAGLYVYKDLNFTAGLYALYTIIAIFGYLKWKRMMERVVE